jgi:hypothetical protein
MFPVKGTVLPQFQLFLGVSPVLMGGIVAAFTFAALKRHQFHHRFLACHNSSCRSAPIRRFLAQPSSGIAFDSAPIRRF